MCEDDFELLCEITGTTESPVHVPKENSGESEELRNESGSDSELEPLRDDESSSSDDPDPCFPLIGHVPSDTSAKDASKPTISDEDLLLHVVAAENLGWDQNPFLDTTSCLLHEQIPVR